MGSPHQHILWCEALPTVLAHMHLEWGLGVIRLYCNYERKRSRMEAIGNSTWAAMLNMVSQTRARRARRGPYRRGRR